MQSDGDHFINLLLCIDINLSGINEGGVAFLVFDDVEHFSIRIEKISDGLVVDFDETEFEEDFGVVGLLELLFF